MAGAPNCAELLRPCGSNVPLLTAPATGPQRSANGRRPSAFGSNRKASSLRTAMSAARTLAGVAGPRQWCGQVAVLLDQIHGNVPHAVAGAGDIPFRHLVGRASAGESAAASLAGRALKLFELRRHVSGVLGHWSFLS